MQRFAFIIHPLVAKDILRKYSFAKQIPENCLEFFAKYIPPFKLSHITGIKSPHAEAEGWFIACPLTARQMLELPEKVVLDKIIQCGKIAERLGAKILGLGAFTSVVADAGITVAKNLNIAVTSGNSYTVATALEGTREAAKLMGIDFAQSNIVIIGATGSIGAACAQILVKECHSLTLVARTKDNLLTLSDKLKAQGHHNVTISSEIKQSLRKADIVIAVTSAVDCIIEPEDLKPGAIVCDVARPRNVSRDVALNRKDVLVIEGGIVRVPGDVDFGFDFGFPSKTSYACMAETMLLALEGQYESFTLGRDLSVEQIEYITKLAKKHDFHLAGFRNFERPVTDNEIENIQRYAHFKTTF